MPSTSYTRPEDSILSGSKPATVRFEGETRFAQGQWLGLELDTADGKHDGAVQDHRYFACAARRGIFVKATQARPLPDSDGRCSGDGRGQGGGGANDGAVLGGGQRISGALASPSQPPSHVLTPLTFPCDGIGARRSSQPPLVVVLAPLESSGAAERPARASGADGRGVWLCGRRAGCMLCLDCVGTAVAVCGLPGLLAPHGGC